MLLLEIVLLGAGIAIGVAVAALVLHEYCAHQRVRHEDARVAAHAADRLVLDQVIGHGTGGPRPPEPFDAWVDDALLRALEEL